MKPEQDKQTLLQTVVATPSKSRVVTPRAGLTEQTSESAAAFQRQIEASEQTGQNPVPPSLQKELDAIEEKARTTPVSPVAEVASFGSLDEAMQTAALNTPFLLPSVPHVVLTVDPEGANLSGEKIQQAELSAVREPAGYAFNLSVRFLALLLAVLLSSCAATVTPDKQVGVSLNATQAWELYLAYKEYKDSKSAKAPRNVQP